jgi:phage-related protein
VSALKPIFWMGRSKSDLSCFPHDVKVDVGHALYEAQLGGKAASAKPLQGYGGAGVLEIVEDDDGNTYRAVYTVKFAEGIYVLHAFQKKSKSGRATPKTEMDIVDARLALARKEHQQWRAR